MRKLVSLAWGYCKLYVIWNVELQLRWSRCTLSLLRSLGFNPDWLHMKFAMDEVALYKVSFRASSVFSRRISFQYFSIITAPWGKRQPWPDRTLSHPSSLGSGLHLWPGSWLVTESGSFSLPYIEPKLHYIYSVFLDRSTSFHLNWSVILKIKLEDWQTDVHFVHFLQIMHTSVRSCMVRKTHVSFSRT
jgi:hypothetical protein